MQEKGRKQAVRKLIGVINMTLDGFCDHTAIIPDVEIHQHYTDLLNKADTILYGRITYQLMEYWLPFVKNPSGDKAMDAFAMAIDKVQKIVFSHKPQKVEWHSAKFSNQPVEKMALELKQQSGKDIFAGSRSIILQLMNHNLIDEIQICIHPVLAGKGLPLFEQITERINLKLLKTKTFKSGAIILYYSPANTGK